VLWLVLCPASASVLLLRVAILGLVLVACHRCSCRCRRRPSLQESCIDLASSCCNAKYFFLPLDTTSTALACIVLLAS